MLHRCWSCELMYLVDPIPPGWTMSRRSRTTLEHQQKVSGLWRYGQWTSWLKHGGMVFPTLYCSTHQNSTGLLCVLTSQQHLPQTQAPKNGTTEWISGYRWLLVLLVDRAEASLWFNISTGTTRMRFRERAAARLLAPSRTDGCSSGWMEISSSR